MESALKMLKIALPAALLAFTACSGGSDEDTGTGNPDGGPVADSGPQADAGPEVDTGPRDFGPRPDSGPRPDAGAYCTMGGEATVDGTQVPLADVSGEPTTPGGGTPSLSCIDDPLDEEPPFKDDYCLVECVDFFGATPSAAEVAGLEIAVFPQEVNGVAVDPTFDANTGLDREPQNRADVRFVLAPESGQRCDSMWQLELGFTNLGNDTLSAETKYIVRVRSSSTAATPYPTTYHYNFIRRNDETPDVNTCNNIDQLIPDPNLEFPVLTPAFMTAAVTEAGGVPGADNFADGLGQGHAFIESRDCVGTGSFLNGATIGFGSAPAGAYYVNTAGDAVDTAATETSDRGGLVAVGLGGNTATSSATASVVFAVGASRDGTCTEQFGGLTIPIYADGVTYVRTGRETVVNDR